MEMIIGNGYLEHYSLIYVLNWLIYQNSSLGEKKKYNTLKKIVELFMYP